MTVFTILGVLTVALVPDVKIYPIDQLKICTSPTASTIITPETIPAAASAER